jgi:hypothetical protein
MNIVTRTIVITVTVLCTLCACAGLPCLGWGLLSGPVDTTLEDIVEGLEQQEPRREPTRLEFGGYGNEATDQFHLNAGLLRSTYTHDGDMNFIVELLDSDSPLRTPMVLGTHGGTHGARAAWLVRRLPQKDTGPAGRVPDVRSMDAAHTNAHRARHQAPLLLAGHGSH